MSILLKHMMRTRPAGPVRIAPRNKPTPRVCRFDFDVNPPQHEFLTDNETDHLAMIGGIGSGKSFALMAWHAMESYRQAGRGTVGGIFANTYQQLNQATLPHLWAFLENMGMEYGEDYVYNQAPPRFWQYQSRFKKHTNVITIREWGQSITRSLDQPHNLRGVELGFASMDEIRDAKPESLRVVLGRLRCPKVTNPEFHPLRIATSPNGFDWVYEEFVERADEMAGVRRVIHASTRDNFALDPSYVRGLERAYDKRTAQQEIEGMFVPIGTGLVYHEFKRSDHLVSVTPSENLDILISFDFNRTPYCVIMAQRLPRRGGDDILVVFDEICQTDAQTSQVCDEILSRIPDTFNKRVAVYGDASGRSRDTRNNMSDYDIITQKFESRFHGRFERRWPRKNPEVMASINAVNAMFRNANNQVRLLVDERCKTLRRDLEQVAFRKGSRDIEKNKDRSLTHASDALRYLVHAEFPISRPEVGGVNW